MSAVRLGAWQPSYFNQNGESANLVILQHWLSLGGVQSKLAAVLDLADIDDLNFLLCGDAGRAALRHFGKELIELAVGAALASAGPWILFQGNSFEYVAEAVLAQPLVEVERQSKFCELSSDSGLIRGYLNSRRAPVGLARKGRFIGTSLHGPVLASSPKFRQDLLSQLIGTSPRSADVDAIVRDLERDLGWD